MGSRTVAKKLIELGGDTPEAEELAILRRAAQITQSLGNTSVGALVRPYINRDREPAYFAIRRCSDKGLMELTTHSTSPDRFAVTPEGWEAIGVRAPVWLRKEIEA